MGFGTQTDFVKEYVRFANGARVELGVNAKRELLFDSPDCSQAQGGE